MARKALSVPTLLLLWASASVPIAGSSSVQSQSDGEGAWIPWWRPASSDPSAGTQRPQMQHVIQPSANLNAGDLDCMTDLGLADGTIPDQNITGWPNVSFSGAAEYSSPSGARLNAASAWCVNASSFPEQDATLTIDLGSSRLISGFRVQPAPAEVHSRDYSSFAALEYSLDGDAWTLCCSMETVGVSHSFRILDPEASSDTIRDYDFGVLKLARYVRFRFDKSSWPQSVQCVRLELVGCEEGWLPAPRIWHVADARGWLDIMWQPLSANLHNGETPVISRLPVDRFALEVLHREGSEHVASRGETTGTRWTVARPLWGAAYELLLWVQIAGVQFPWAQYSVRAKLGCPDGQQRCAADGAVFELPDVLLSSWDSANNTLTANWSMTSHGWRVPEFMFSVVVSEAGSGITNQIISSSVTGRDMPNLASDQDYEVFITPVVPELTSPPTFHRKVVLVSTSPAQSAELSKIVEQGGSSSSSVAAVTADVSLRAWPRWAGDIAVQWRPAVLRGDGGDLPASAYRLVVSADGRQLRSDLVDGARTAAVFEWRYTGTVAAGTEYRIHVECSFPTRNFSCGAVTVTPTAPDAATPTDSGWLVLDVPEPAGSWAEASSTCQRRGGHLVAVTSADRQQQLTDLLERRGLSQAWIGLSVCPPFTGAWSDGSRARFEDMGTPPPAAAGECCVKLFRTEDVTSGTVHYQWRMDMCQSVLPPICASRVEGELLNPVENLTARSEYPLSLDLSWQPRSSGWAPSSCLIQVCPTRDLSQRETSLTLPCTNWTSSDGRQAHISGLPGYHEFQVTVWSQLASIQSTEAAYVTARSLSLLPLSVAISRSGLLTAVWQRKVVAGAGDQAADVVLRRMDVAEPPSPSVQALSQALAAAQRAADLEADGAASAVGAATAEPLSRLSTDRARRQPSDNIRWSGLELGARYLLALFDADSNHTTDYVAFSAGPTCMSGEYQLGALCFWPSQEAATYSEALSTCDTSGDARPASASLRARPWVAPIATREEYQLVKNISLVLNKSFWVVQREKRRRRRDLTRRSEPGDVELLPGFKEPPPEPTSDPLAELLSEDLAVNTAEENFTEMDAAAESDVEFSEPTVLKPCTYVQQDRSGIQASTSSCDQEMQAMCSTNITVTLPEFRESDLRIEPSSSHIRIDWIVPEAWSASYLVTVYKRPPPTPGGAETGAARTGHDVRIKRAATSDTYKSPPVVLEELEENALYEVTIVRDSAGKQTMVGPVVIRALDPPRQPSMFPVDDGPRMCLALSYVIVMVTGLLVAIILLLARVPVPEGIYQVTVAITVSVGYLFVLLSHGGPLSAGGTAGCRAAAAITHLAFSVALALPGLLGGAAGRFPGRHAWAVPLLAAGPQTAVVMLLIAAAVDSRGYVDAAPQTCWLDLDPNNAIMWVVACHLLIIWLAGLFLAFRALTLPSDKVPLAMKHADKAKRKSALGRLRFTTTALLVLLAACWALGAAAAFFGNRTLVICEAVSTVLLAAALGAMCADTFIAGARPWRQRVMPQKGAAAAPRPGGRPPANLTLTTVHPAGSTSNNMFVKRTFHFGADPAEADKKIILSMPTPE